MLMNNNIDRYLKEIRKCYPGLTIQNINLLDPNGGQYNDVLTAESPTDALIFRFPRNEVGILTIENELRILGRIQKKTTLPVPNPIYCSQKSHVPGKVFMGYPRLPGKALLRDHLNTADNPTLQKWAIQLTQFLVELHNIPTDDFTDLSINETLDEYQQLYAEICQYLFPHLQPRYQQKTADHFQNYFNNPDLQSYPIALRHGDFGAGNILYDPNTFNITGIIDFGFAGVGDPAIDIAALSTLRDTFFNFVKETYPDIEPLLARGRFYKGTFLLYEALYGLKTDNQDIFQEALTAYIQKIDL